MQAPAAPKLRILGLRRVICGLSLVAIIPTANALAQSEPPMQTSVQIPAPSEVVNPIAIVPLDSQKAGSAAVVTGALQVVGGRALISSNGPVTSGPAPTEVALPRRGTLRICSSTTVKLATDSSAAAGEIPGLLMAIDHGALEASFATGQNADTVLTPDFRILIGGPGASNVKVRLGQGGDTCVDNPGSTAPYVLVTSVFDGRLYRVQPGQRVMFQHGSLDTVVDQEKEPCDCPPPPADTQGNDFPLAQSEGLAPAAIAKAAPTPSKKKVPVAAPPLVYNAGQVPPPSADTTTTDVAQNLPPSPGPKRKHPNFFIRIGHMFRRIFGAE